MNIKEIKEIVTLMNANEINEFVIEREGFKLCIKKGSPPTAGEMVSQIAVPAAPAVVPASLVAQPALKEEREEKGGKEGVFVVSPMVGTFFSSASPDTPPFVEVGQEVDKDTVVCIIEAMKVMNEIKAEKEGTILEILVESGEPVEFGKRLFKIG